MATADNAELLAMSGPRTRYPGKLGVVEAGALADLILVDGDPTIDLSLVAERMPVLLSTNRTGQRT